MRINTAEGDEAVEVQMAPLIDCVFLLLIFFLVATTLKKISREVPLELPESIAAVNMTETPDMTIVALDKYGRTYIDGKQVTESQLHEKFKELGRTRPESRVRIDTDRTTQAQEILRVLDLCQFEGLRNVGFHALDERTRAAAAKRPPALAD